MKFRMHRSNLRMNYLAAVSRRFRSEIMQLLLGRSKNVV